MLMSFYGSIGNIMAGWGIDKLFENIYDQKAESVLLIKLQRMALFENSNEEGVNNIDLEVTQTL